MVVRIKVRSKSNIDTLLTILIFFSSTLITIGKVIASDSPNIGIRVPSKYQYGIPLFPKQLARGLSMLDFVQPSQKKTPRSLKHDVKIDSTGQEVSIKETTFNYPYHLPALYSLEQYTHYCLQQNLPLIWQNYSGAYNH